MPGVKAAFSLRPVAQTFDLFALLMDLLEKGLKDNCSALPSLQDMLTYAFSASPREVDILRPLY